MSLVLRTRLFVLQILQFFFLQLRLRGWRPKGSVPQSERTSQTCNTQPTQVRRYLSKTTLRTTPAAGCCYLYPLTPLKTRRDRSTWSEYLYTLCVRRRNEELKRKNQQIALQYRKRYIHPFLRNTHGEAPRKRRNTPHQQNSTFAQTKNTAVDNKTSEQRASL